MIGSPIYQISNDRGEKVQDLKKAHQYITSFILWLPVIKFEMEKMYLKRRLYIPE